MLSQPHCFLRLTLVGRPNYHHLSTFFSTICVNENSVQSALSIQVKTALPIRNTKRVWASHCPHCAWSTLTTIGNRHNFRVGPTSRTKWRRQRRVSSSTTITFIAWLASFISPSRPSSLASSIISFQPTEQATPRLSGINYNTCRLEENVSSSFPSGPCSFAVSSYGAYYLYQGIRCSLSV